jgi:hypothetical protein
MSLNEIMLIVISGGVFVFTMYMMLCAIFSPTPRDSEFAKKKEPEMKTLAKSKAKG